MPEIEYSVQARAVGVVWCFGHKYHPGDTVRIQMGRTHQELVARIAAAMNECSLLDEASISRRVIDDWAIVSNLNPVTRHTPPDALGGATDE